MKTRSQMNVYTYLSVSGHYTQCWISSEIKWVARADVIAFEMFPIRLVSVAKTVVKWKTWSVYVARMYVCVCVFARRRVHKHMLSCTWFAHTHTTVEDFMNSCPFAVSHRQIEKENVYILQREQQQKQQPDFRFHFIFATFVEMRCERFNWIRINFIYSRLQAFRSFLLCNGATRCVYLNTIRFIWMKFARHDTPTHHTHLNWTSIETYYRHFTGNKKFSTHLSSSIFGSSTCW